MSLNGASRESILAEVAKMPKPKKLSALLLMLGPENAANLLKLFDEQQIEELVTEITKISLLDNDEQKAILREFATLALKASTSVSGGIDAARAALERSVGIFKAADILGRVGPPPTASGSIQQLSEMESEELFNLIKKEQVQTIALILSYLPPDKGAKISSMLRSEKRISVLERLATLTPTPVDVAEKVAEVVLSQTGTAPPKVLNRTGGVTAAAAILNSMEKNLSKTVLFSLEEQNAELGQNIRQKMFTFEDLASIEPMDLQKVLRDVDMRDLAISLKSASDKLKKILLGCLSKRAAESVEEEMEFMGPLRLTEIEAAQNRIIEAARQLEGEDEIETEAANTGTRA